MSRAQRFAILFGASTLFLFCALIQYQILSNQRPRSNPSAYIAPQVDLTLLKYTGNYVPAPAEQYVIENADRLGLNAIRITAETQLSCKLFVDKDATPYYDALQQYTEELDHYNNLVSKFAPIPDLRKRLDVDKTICKTVDLHPAGLSALFPSGLLSHSESFGYVEPLLPPLRHPLFCSPDDPFQHLMRTDYMLHDFGAMCRKLKPTSRTVFIDMGASLSFHSGGSPVFSLIEEFEKFGFPFDHIYAYEVTPANPAQVFELLPDNLQASFHWVNVGVSAIPDSKFNPLSMLLKNFDKDDLIIVKLDIDFTAIEVPLAYQLLENDRLCEMIDHFYFEHHVILKEIAGHWKSSMEGSIETSLGLFTALRRRGVAAHYWV